LLEAYRLRKSNAPLDVRFSHINLGMLRLAQGDARSASRHLDKAVELATPSHAFLPLFTIQHKRGKARMAEGRLADALADFQTCIDFARRWRREVLEADSFRTSMAAELQQVYSSFIEAGNQLYFKTRRRKLARDTFEASEENRAVGLLAWLESAGWKEKLPPEYWEVLARLRAAEISALREQTATARDDVEELGLTLAEIETRAGLDLATRPEERLLQLQRKLRPQQAYLSFHLRDSESYLWAVTQDQFRLYRLPGRSRIAAQRNELLAAIRDGSDDVGFLGERLYQQLFGGLPQDIRSMQHWLLALDDVLFDVPFAALVAGHEGGRPIFLVERNAVQVVPAAILPGRAGPLEGPFVGIGDPIYNTADPRWKPRGWSGMLAFVPLLGARAADGNPLQMPRLPGSAREIRACAKLWRSTGGSSSLLLGSEASERALRASLTERPSVLHFAAHVVRSPHQRDVALIGLSLGSREEPEFLSPTQIAGLDLSSGLVLLSGCSSGQGEAVPGEGLMGLARAWLAAGAGAVVASHWPTSDDTGEIFLSFYKYLRGSTALDARVHAALALRRAQLDMLRSGTWRALPKYWAAYFVYGKE
jgi:CHAT domain-containing protein